MHTPVTTRSKGAAGEAGLTASSKALASAPTVADAANRRRGSTRSGRPRIALAKQPRTKPACTPLVSAAWEKFERWNSAASAGVTAEADNQSAIAATWQISMIATDARFDVAQVSSIVLGSRVSGLTAAQCSDFWQRDALLALILSAAILVRRLADLVGLEEDHLRDPLVGIDLRGERRRIRELERHGAFPLGLERRDVDDDAAARIGRLSETEDEDVARNSEVLNRSGKRKRVRRDDAGVALEVDE